MRISYWLVEGVLNQFQGIGYSFISAIFLLAAVAGGEALESVVGNQRELKIVDLMEPDLFVLMRAPLWQPSLGGCQ